jgi:hypothetical protein
LALLVLVLWDSTISYFVCMYELISKYVSCVLGSGQVIGKSSSDVSGLERLIVGELFLDEMTIYRETKEFTELLGVFFKKHNTNTDAHTRINTYPYKHMYIHSTLMSTSERLSRLDLEIYEVGNQERIAINGDIISTKK